MRGRIYSKGERKLEKMKKTEKKLTLSRMKT